MALTIKQTEAMPDSYPASGLSPEPDNAQAVWARLEAYIAWRWTPRAVVWVVEGPGEWVPPLSPAAIETVEVWSGADEWETVELQPSPLGGYWLPHSGPFRIVGLVGDTSPNDAPAAVLEAFRRLSAHMSAEPGMPGVRSESETIAGVITHQYDRSAAWLANAMVNSGAGDLLRPYRRA